MFYNCFVLIFCTFLFSFPFTNTSPPNTKAPRKVSTRKLPVLVKLDLANTEVTLSHSPVPCVKASPDFGVAGELFPLIHFVVKTAGRITGESSLLQKLSLNALNSLD